MKKITLLFFAFVLFSCTGQNPTNQKVSVDQAVKIMKQNDFQVLDVRTADEYSEGNVPGSQNIDWYAEDFNNQLKSLDKNKPVLVYCKVGGRSAQAAERLSKLGFTQVYDMEGGFMKWQKVNAPTDAWTGMTMADYEKLKASQPELLVNFYAEWCAPCRKMAPYMNKLIEESNGKVVRIDVDKNKSLYNALNLEALPVIFIYKNKKETFRHEGFLSETDLKKQWP